jgi:hypothetical protein
LEIILKYENIKIINDGDWDNLVQETYEKPYCFQQQDGCKLRGIHYLTIPSNEFFDYTRDTIPDKINGAEMGVSFAAWLARDPEEWSGPEEDKDCIDLFWHRNFYPDVQMIANDLYNKGLIEAGEYAIDINW